jgi:hypothetical protein
MVEETVRYVIELGERHKKADATFEWVSRGYYNLFEPNGGPMIVVDKIEDAYHFDTKENAERVIAGCNLSGTSRVVEHA